MRTLTTNPQLIRLVYNETMQKGQTQVLILAGIVILLTVASGIFFLGRVTVPKPEAPVTTSSPQPSPLSTEAPAKVEDPTANWKTYTNTKIGYSLKYSPDWTLRECPKDCDYKTSEATVIDSSLRKIKLYEGDFRFYSIVIQEKKFELPPIHSKEVINDVSVSRHIDCESGIGGEFVLFTKSSSQVVTTFSPYHHNICINEDESYLPFSDQNEYYTTFNQILSTFKFID